MCCGAFAGASAGYFAAGVYSCRGAAGTVELSDDECRGAERDGKWPHAFSPVGSRWMLGGAPAPRALGLAWNCLCGAVVQQTLLFVLFGASAGRGRRGARVLQEI